MESYVKLNHICKNFNHVKALNDASIEAFKGEVLAIVGDNGAGKSTLIKILSGVLRPDSGEIRIGEKCYSSLSVSKALNAGVSTVYQDLALANTLNVTTNIFIGQEIIKHGILQKDEMDRQARKLLDDLDVDIPDTAEIAGNLSGGQKAGHSCGETGQSRRKHSDLRRADSCHGGCRSVQNSETYTKSCG